MQISLRITLLIRSTVYQDFSCSRFICHMVSGGNSGHRNNGEGSDPPRGKPSHQRHSPHQTQRLEAVFRECRNPNEDQRIRLGIELGLEPHQIKTWFQNKRSQTKTQEDRFNNTTLREANERLYCENLTGIEELKNAKCIACSGSSFNNESANSNLISLRLENASLKEKLVQYQEVFQLFFINEATMPLSPPLSISEPPMDLSTSTSLLPTGISNHEKSLMSETASGAMEELLLLLKVNEPLWIKSSSPSGEYVLHTESYKRTLSKISHYRGLAARVESSKDSGLVAMGGRKLVEMFTDPIKWADLFPTIVTHVNMIHVIGGIPENDNSSLQFMRVQMHSLSPLVPPREYYILRHCKQVGIGIWAIADISYVYSRENRRVTPFRCWKLPSGCLIEDMPDESCKVTWIEHVEVDDKSLTHRLYKDLVCSGTIFGAKRWITTLQRMCERFQYSIAEITHDNRFRAGVTLVEGQRSIKNLSHRMIKSFCAMLPMLDKSTDFSQFSETTSSGLRVSVRTNTQTGQPSGTIVSASTSVWLPLSPQDVFNFFIDEKMHHQWDILSDGISLHEVAHISNGIHPGNCISIFEPNNPTENPMSILQESSTDELGSILVYAVVDTTLRQAVENFEKDPSNIPLLPSGFIISGDGGGSENVTNKRFSRSGSLLTVIFQTLSSPIQQPSMESIAMINALISSAVHRIKSAMNCTELD